MVQKKSKSRFALVLTFTVVFVLGVGALGIVWMRMEISKVAKHCRDLEDRREIVSREVQDLGREITFAQALNFGSHGFGDCPRLRLVKPFMCRSRIF